MTPLVIIVAETEDPNVDGRDEAGVKVLDSDVANPGRNVTCMCSCRAMNLLAYQ